MESVIAYFSSCICQVSWFLFASVFEFGHVLFQWLSVHITYIVLVKFAHALYQLSLDMHCVDDWVWTCIVLCRLSVHMCWLSLDVHCVGDWVWTCIVSIIEFGPALHWYFNKIWLLVCRWLISCISVLSQSKYVYLMCSLWALYFIKFSCWMVWKTA